MVLKQKTIWIVLVCVFSLLGASVVTADMPPVSKVGVVVLERIFDEYEETDASEEELKRLTLAKQSEREKMVSEIRGMRDEMVLLNEESRQEQRSEIESKLQGLAQFDQETKQMLASRRNQEVRGLLVEIEDAVKVYAEQNGVDVVLTNRAVLYGIDAIDITDGVLEVLNRRMASSDTGAGA